MYIIIAILLLIHGVAHLVGFVVPWKITKIDDMPYKTTLFYGKINLKDVGIRFVGLLWLLAFLGYAATAILVFLHIPAWISCTFLVTAFSIILCILGLPDPKIGVIINLAIFIFLFVGTGSGWIG